MRVVGAGSDWNSHHAFLVESLQGEVVEDGGNHPTEKALGGIVGMRGGGGKEGGREGKQEMQL